MKKRSQASTLWNAGMMFLVSAAFMAIGGYEKTIQQGAASFGAAVFLFALGLIYYFQDRDKKLSVGEIAKLGWDHKYTNPNGCTEWTMGRNVLEWDPKVKWLMLQTPEGNGMSGSCDSVQQLELLMEMFKIKR